jgi:hypothetical protein
MHSHRLHTVLAAGTFLTFGFASAIAAGAVPRDHQPQPAPAVTGALLRHHGSAGRLVHPAGAVARVQHQTATAKPAAARVTRSRTAHHHLAPTVMRATGSHPATPVTSAGPVAHHHHHRHHGKPGATTPTAAPRPHPTKPKLAARTSPSSSAVQAAIQGLKKYVHSVLTPTPSQVAEFGDMVCSAYDKNETTKQIEATILQKVKALPFTTILPGAADYVVRTAVALYCPGYKSRLGSAAA